MSVVIRLSRGGLPGNPQYRIVAANKERCRDGKFLEIVGTYKPTIVPPSIVLKEERIKHWISMGAAPSLTVRNIIRKKLPGYLEEIDARRLKKTVEKRKARKARSAKKPAKKSSKKSQQESMV